MPFPNPITPPPFNRDLARDFWIAVYILGLRPWVGVPYAVHAVAVPARVTPQPCRPWACSTDDAAAFRVFDRLAAAHQWRLLLTSAADGTWLVTLLDGTGFAVHEYGPTRAAALSAAIVALWRHPRPTLPPPDERTPAA